MHLCNTPGALLAGETGSVQLCPLAMRYVSQGRTAVLKRMGSIARISVACLPAVLKILGSISRIFATLLAFFLLRKQVLYSHCSGAGKIHMLRKINMCSEPCEHLAHCRQRHRNRTATAVKLGPYGPSSYTVFARQLAMRYASQDRTAVLKSIGSISRISVACLLLKKQILHSHCSGV